MSHTLTHDYLCIMHVSALVLPCYRLLPAITLNVHEYTVFTSMLYISQADPEIN